MQQPLPFIHHKKTEVRVAPFLKRKRVIRDDDCDDPVVVSSASSAPRVIHDDVCDDPVVDSSASSAPNVSATGPADAQLLLQQQMDDGCSAIDASRDKRDIHDDVCDDPVVDSSVSSAPNVSAAGPADAQLLLQQQMDDGCSAIDVSSDSGDDLLVAPAACEQPSPASDAQPPSQQQLIPFTAKIPFSAKTLKDYFGPISCEEYFCNVDKFTQSCIMDLRFVVPVTIAHNLIPAIGGSLSAGTSASSSSSESGSNSPQKLKNGYVIDDFIVDTDDGSCSSHSGSD
jgi:hypothetical protein